MKSFYWRGCNRMTVNSSFYRPYNCKNCAISTRNNISFPENLGDSTKFPLFEHKIRWYMHRILVANDKEERE